ncbi:MAG: hypothetical protein HYV16_08450 [Gammaproteobacteria bacterium]|nr:hypothetical protein [Gammaproteobacteria bacterium]
MINRHLIRAYVRALATHLHTLDQADADEVIREIEGHLHDVVDLAEERGEDLDVAALLEGFGPPQSLAAQYIAHLQHGTPPPAGFRVLHRVRLGVTRGLYYSMGGFGFSIAAALLWLALAKLFAPDTVGVWSVAGGNAYVISWSGSPQPQAEELLGWMLLPIALLAALWCAEITRRVLKVLRRGLI